jgi:uroporphyrinogen-III synthase
VTVRVLVTRSEPGASRQARALIQAGFDAVVAPVLHIEPTDAPIPDGPFQHVIFLSEQAVRYGGDLGYCAGARVHAVGETTARALAARGLSAEVPAIASSEGVLEQLSALPLAGSRVLIVAGEEGRKTLRDALRARGAEVLEHLCYRRVAMSEMSVDPAGIDVVLVGSQDGFRAFARLWFGSGGPDVPVIAASARIAALGETLGFTDVRSAGGAGTGDWITALERRRGND